ncbi:MAG TPA: hypothetical protein VGJ81_00815 [Thermoanaerobaculia bacterium]|jgi:hypothetical protein
MTRDRIAIELLSDTTFSGGSSTAGEVDIEVDHDDLGLPRFGGKTIRGILRDSWLSMAEHFPDLAAAAENILGAGAAFADTVVLRIDDASVDAHVREAVRLALTRTPHPLGTDEILRSLSDIRYQTAEERATGAPARASLRASRVWLRGLVLFSNLRWLRPPTDAELRCLALVLLGSRHAGLSRNRGRGFLRMTLIAPGQNAPDLQSTRLLATEKAR